MDKTMERLARSFMVIRSQLEKAQREGKHKDDEVILATANRIGLAMQIAGKGIQESAQSKKFLDIIYYLSHIESLVVALGHILDVTIGDEFRELRGAEPEDFK